MEYNKKGWMRILEAAIAVLIVSAALLTVYSTRQSTAVGPDEYIFSLQKQVLQDISFQANLRRKVLEDNESALNVYAGTKIPNNLNYSVRICNLTDPPEPCKLKPEEFLAILKKDIFVEETIISSDIYGYNPKKVKLFVWEERRDNLI